MLCASISSGRVRGTPVGGFGFVELSLGPLQYAEVAVQAGVAVVELQAVLISLAGEFEPSEIQQDVAKVDPDTGRIRAKFGTAPEKLDGLFRKTALMTRNGEEAECVRVFGDRFEYLLVERLRRVDLAYAMQACCVGERVLEGHLGRHV